MYSASLCFTSLFLSSCSRLYGRAEKHRREKHAWRAVFARNSSNLINTAFTIHSITKRSTCHYQLITARCIIYQRHIPHVTTHTHIHALTCSVLLICTNEVSCNSSTNAHVLHHKKEMFGTRSLRILSSCSSRTFLFSSPFSLRIHMLVATMCRAQITGMRPVSREISRLFLFITFLSKVHRTIAPDTVLCFLQLDFYLSMLSHELCTLGSFPTLPCNISQFKQNVIVLRR